MVQADEREPAEEPEEASEDADDETSDAEAAERADDEAGARDRDDDADADDREDEGDADVDDRADENERKKPPPPLPGAGTRDGEKLREAFRAFEVGDYRRARSRVAELVDAEDAEVREVALDLHERMSVDPVQVVVIVACAAVLFTIVYVWIL
ncbi:MAG TPA: hypothetical protein RMH99_15870 [Sandaracinaceae bacterium LLY-WYZ-13_1]|nr:hypothetical protein [Sandaracinaceae bacterium LLY-WYZ-13_1]